MQAENRTGLGVLLGIAGFFVGFVIGSEFIWRGGYIMRCLRFALLVVLRVSFLWVKGEACTEYWREF